MAEKKLSEEMRELGERCFNAQDISIADTMDLGRMADRAEALEARVEEYDRVVQTQREEIIKLEAREAELDCLQEKLDSMTNSRNDYRKDAKWWKKAHADIVSRHANGNCVPFEKYRDCREKLAEAERCPWFQSCIFGSGGKSEPVCDGSLSRLRECTEAYKDAKMATEGMTMTDWAIDMGASSNHGEGNCVPVTQLTKEVSYRMNIEERERDLRERLRDLHEDSPSMSATEITLALDKILRDDPPAEPFAEERRLLNAKQVFSDKFAGDIDDPDPA